MATLGELTAQAKACKDKGTTNVAELEKNQREKPWLKDSSQVFIGQIVFHLGDPDSAWMIMDWRSPTDKSWCWCEMNGSKQWFPTAAMAVVATPKYVDPATVPARVVEKKEKPEKPVGDIIAQLLASGTDPWAVLEMAKCGIDVDETRKKIGHLSNGLQRMGIGNRLRVAWKQNKFNAEALLAKLTKGK